MPLDEGTKDVLDQFDAKDEPDRIERAKKRTNDFWKNTYPKEKCYDLEAVPIFREHKINQLEAVL